MPFLAGPPLSDDLRERLQGAVVEMHADKFFRDMSVPIQTALIALKDEANCFDSVSAKECRKKALISLEASEKQLGEAAKNKMFVAEHTMVAAALAQIKGDEGHTAEVAAAVDIADTAKATIEATKPTGDQAKQQAANVAMLNAKQMADKGQEAPKPAAPKVAEAASEFVASDPPYTWNDLDDDGSVAVYVPVPSGTQKKDVSVTFKPKRLAVSVAGHPLSPVIDIELLYAVQSDSCSWGLEGSGAKRKININLEKVTMDEKWGALVNDEKGRSIKEVAGSLQGMGLEQWTPDHTK